MWELDHKEGWAQKTWCFLTIVPEKTLESPLGSKEIKQVNPKGSQPWIFIGRTEAEAEAPKLWPPDVKSHLTGKKLWCWERLKSKGKGGSSGWDGWMASPTQWTWVWVYSGSWWWTERPGELQSMGSQGVRQNWAPDWTEMNGSFFKFFEESPHCFPQWLY